MKLLITVLAALIVACSSQEFWINDVEHGHPAFNSDPANYQVYRNVMDFGCRGDGVTDDTACINTAISSGVRCGEGCGSSTVEPAIVYFPSGTYLVSAPIIQYYYTQLIGNPNNRPTLLAAPNFGGIGLIDSDPYGNGGANWYTNQNNFFRQIRNFIIDLTQTPTNFAATGIHWQVAQATSLVNIHFAMSKEAGTAHQGIWMENGSGGFMSDLTFDGGFYGMWVGNQQFLTRNLQFTDCQTAIYMNWNWQWTFKNVQINNCQLGIEMTAPSTPKASGVGSILLLDSTITDTPIGVKMIGNLNPVQDTSGTLLLDNVQLNNVATAVADINNGVILAGGTLKITSWGRGSLYTDDSGHGVFQVGNLPAFSKSANLLDGQGNFFEKSRPQYEQYGAGDFANVYDYGATGNGNTDDTAAIQAAIDANAGGKVIYFPHGAYIISNTINVRPGTRMIGELWSILMASGSAFQDAANPIPMLQVGAPGDVGDIEITDFIFSTKGPQAGATLVEWNIKGAAQGSAGIWDSHFRVGGYAGSQLQQGDCPAGEAYKPECIGAFMLLHITAQASGYFENVWAWTADHDLDGGAQVSLYTGRGVLVESTDGPVWLYGTQSEHNVMYEYQLTNANNVFLTMIQGETPYWQPAPKAPQPFDANANYDDPDYAYCDPGSATCNLAYGLRIHNSQNVYLYGAGLYNFFNNYDQTCLDTESCQDSMIDLEDNNGIYLFNLNTKAATNIIVADNTQVLATNADNANNFCQSINAFYG